MTDRGRRFRVGDKVRLLMHGDTIYEIIEVIEDYGGRYRLSDSYGTWGGQYLELVEPYDPRKDFLTRLQGLLEEFNAEIDVWGGEDGDCGLCFGICHDNGLISNLISYSHEWPDCKFDFPITASNIMDFEKE